MDEGEAGRGSSAWDVGWRVCLKNLCVGILTVALQAPMMLEFYEAVLNPPFLFAFCFVVLLFPTFLSLGRFLVSEIACRVGNLGVSIVQPPVGKAPMVPSVEVS